MINLRAETFPRAARRITYEYKQYPKGGSYDDIDAETRE
jgi:hypothetical protein